MDAKKTSGKSPMSGNRVSVQFVIDGPGGKNMVPYRMPITEPLKAVMQAWCKRKELPYGKVRFFCEEGEVTSSSKPIDYALAATGTLLISAVPNRDVMPTSLGSKRRASAASEAPSAPVPQNGSTIPLKSTHGAAPKEELVEVQVIGQGSTSWRVSASLPPTKPFEKLTTAWSTQSQQRARFVCNGKEVLPSDTPRSVGWVTGFGPLTIQAIPCPAKSLEEHFLVKSLDSATNGPARSNEDAAPLMTLAGATEKPSSSSSSSSSSESEDEAPPQQKPAEKPNAVEQKPVEKPSLVEQRPVEKPNPVLPVQTPRVVAQEARDDDDDDGLEMGSASGAKLKWGMASLSSSPSPTASESATNGKIVLESVAPPAKKAKVAGEHQYQKADAEENLEPEEEEEEFEEQGPEDIQEEDDVVSVEAVGEEEAAEGDAAENGLFAETEAADEAAAEELAGGAVAEETQSDELTARCETLEASNADLVARNEKLEAENATLRAEVGQLRAMLENMQLRAELERLKAATGVS